MSASARVQPRPMLTAKEVAAALNLSVSAVRRMTRAGVLPSVRVGSKSIRYAPTVIDDLHAKEDL